MFRAITRSSWWRRWFRIMSPSWGEVDHDRPGIDDIFSLEDGAVVGLHDGVGARPLVPGTALPLQSAECFDAAASGRLFRTLCSPLNRRKTWVWPSSWYQRVHRWKCSLRIKLLPRVWIRMSRGMGWTRVMPCSTAALLTSTIDPVTPRVELLPTGKTLSSSKDAKEGSAPFWVYKRRRTTPIRDPFIRIRRPAPGQHQSAQDGGKIPILNHQSIFFRYDFAYE